MVRKYYRKKRRIRRKYGRGKSYMKNNKIYFDGGIERDSGLVLVLPKLLDPVASVLRIGCSNTRQKNNYVMRRLNTPKRVTLLDGRTFVARYKGVLRAYLPTNVILKRGRRQRAAPRGRRRRQRGRGLFSFVKKLAKNPAVRSLAKQGIKHLPGLYDAATSRIKNDKIRRALQSDLAKGLLNKTVDRYE